jgi:hypothetical protein
MSQARYLAKLASVLSAEGVIPTSKGGTGNTTGAGGGTTVYATLSLLPLSNVTAGSMAYVTENNRLYLWTGTGWYNIALINNNPTITSGPNASYTLSTTGVATVITLAANDPEGLPVTWSYTGTPGNVATVSQANNVFTITPSTSGSDSGTFNLTFIASDGVNLASASSNFSLQFTVNWSTVSLQTDLRSPNQNTAVSGYFGQGVSISGNTAVVGAFLEDTSNVGRVYVFNRAGSTWTTQATLTRPAEITSQLGWGGSAAIDGDTIVAGAQNLTVSGQGGAGAVYVFTRSGTTWTQQQKLTASDPTLNVNFGSGVDISGDTIVVGAGTAGNGAAYVFTRSGTIWTQQQKLTASDGVSGDNFGTEAVAIVGNTIIVGAKSNNGSRGAAYVFTRSGTTWTQQQKLTAGDGAANDNFGRSVAIDPAGTTVACGSLFNDAGGSNAGAVYVFTVSGSTWSQQTKLIGPGTDYWLGGKVALGTNILVAAADWATVGVSNSGQVYRYTRSGTTWSSASTLATGGIASERVGSGGLDISNNTIIVGASSFRTSTAAGSNGSVGRALVYAAGYV